MNPDIYFTYTVNPDDEEPIMLIDRHIGFDEEDGYGIDGALFQKELLALDSMGKKRIQVWINSPGGIVQDGWNIYNAICRTATKVDTYCIGMAASIAGVIFQAGRKRIMNDYGILMYHNPFGGDDKSLDAIKDSLITMISSRSGMQSDAVEKMMKRTTWISAEEAVNMGLCDDIDHSVEFNKKRASVGTDSDTKNNYLEFKHILNSILPTSNNKSSDMKKIANKLGLNMEASEDAIVSEVEKLTIKNQSQADAIAKAESTVKSKDDEIATLKSAVNKAEADKKKAEEELDTAKAAAKKKEEEEAAAKKKKEDDEKTASEASAKNMVANFVKIGKIRNDAKAIEVAEKFAISDPESFKTLYEGTAVNATANKIPAVSNMTEGDKVKMVSVVANKMNKLRASGK